MKYVLTGWIGTINHYHAGHFALSTVLAVHAMLGTEVLHTHLVPACISHQGLVMIGVEPSLFRLSGVRWGHTTLLALYGLTTGPQAPRALAYAG